MAPVLNFANILAALLSLCGLFFLFRSLRGDRSRGRHRCPKCWYELAPTATRCPECGRDIASPRELLRTRRRLPFIALALLLTLAPFGVLFSIRYRAQITRFILGKWELTSRAELAGCTVELYKSRDPVFREARAVVRHRGKITYEISDAIINVGDAALSKSSPIGLGEDVTGDGVPDLVLSRFSGGAHCCVTLDVVQLGDDPKLLASLDVQNGGAFRRTDQPGLAEIVTADPTFAYWRTAYAAAPKPTVVLRFKNGGFHVATEQMLRDPPPAADLDAAAAKIRDSLSPPRSPDNPDLWRTMLDLMYSGHEDLAPPFFESAWPAGREGKEEFLADFNRTLATSPYWPETHQAFTQSR